MQYAAHFHHLRNLCFFVASLLLCQSVNALQLADGQYQWSFLSGEPWPAGYQQATGKPDALTYARSEYSQDFFARLDNALPEARINEAFMTGDAGANIELAADAEVSITFLHEGTGNKNALGFFTFDPSAPPANKEEVQESIAFPNLSYPHLTTGHRLNLGRFRAGSAIGFFLAANGFWYDTGVHPRRSDHYYSLSALNPEQDAGLRQHTVLLLDEESGQVVLGFEDLPRTWGDNDFNDAVFAIKVDPPEALSRVNLSRLPYANDSDADGIDDGQDAFPEDYRRASSRFFPSRQGWVTLAFEDNWPRRGDYDLNDLVVRQRTELFYNSQNLITGLRIRGYIDARGASYHNGFALRLMDIPASLLDSARITIAGEDYTKTAERGQDDLVVQLWRDTHAFTYTGEDGACAHFNTVKTCRNFPSVPFEFELNFNTELAELNLQQFDYFLFRTNFRGREIHLADYPPTQLFDQSQFGKFSDHSDARSGRYFRDENNLPWALMIPTQWRYPREYIDVVWAYPEYEIWVESSGREKNNWYDLSERHSHYY